MLDYLITGGNGFIGRNLKGFLCNYDEEFWIVDSKPGSITTELDISLELPHLKAANLIHLAAETNVRKSIRFPRTFFRNNCDGVVNCLETLRLGLFKRMVFTSSASSKECSSPYLASKAAGEAICDAYGQAYDLDICVLKLSNVYGPYSESKDSVVAKFIKNCLNEEPLTIYGSGSQSRDFVYVDDVVYAIHNRCPGYVTTGVRTSIVKLATIIADISHELTGYSPKIVHSQPIQGEVLIPDIHPKIATVQLEHGLRLTFKWFLEAL